MKKSVIVIVGPTASGKTATAVKLAQMINGEIISADSMQVYRYMDIGTAKPAPEEMGGIKHYLLDEVYPDELFSVVRFKELAENYIGEILKNNKVPIVAGGTGQYISSLVYNIQFSEMAADWGLRMELENIAKAKGNEYLHKELEKIDPIAAEKIHFNNRKRVIRAIEVFKLTGKPITYHEMVSRSEMPEHDFILFGLKTDRKKLYERIDKRVDLMLEKGLIEEVRTLLKSKYDIGKTSLQGLGYKEILYYLRGLSSLDDSIKLLKRNTRRYAKRQLTWFNAMKEIKWINVDYNKSLEEIVKNIYKYIASTGII